MIKNQSTDRLRDAFAGYSQWAQPTEDCPDATTIWEAAAGNLPDRLETIVLHTGSCPACAESWRLASAGVAMSRQEQTTQASVSRSRRIWPEATALAAVATLFLALWLWQPDAQSVKRGGPTGSTSLVMDKVLDPQNCTLRWSKAEPMPISYDLEVFSSQFEPLHKAPGLTETTYTVPADALTDLPLGSQIMWRLEAVYPDSSRHVSATFINALKKKDP